MRCPGLFGAATQVHRPVGNGKIRAEHQHHGHRHRHRIATPTSCRTRRLRPRHRVVQRCMPTMLTQHLAGCLPASAIAIHLADEIGAFPDLSPEIGFRPLHDRDTRRDKSEHVRVQCRGH